MGAAIVWNCIRERGSQACECYEKNLNKFSILQCKHSKKFLSLPIYVSCLSLCGNSFAVSIVAVFC